MSASITFKVRVSILLYYQREISSHNTQIIVFSTGVSAKCVRDLYFVSLIETVDHVLLMNQLHKNFMEEKILELHPGEKYKVILHLDSTPSHKTSAVYEYLDDRDVNYSRTGER
jgi:hypothetical protein